MKRMGDWSIATKLVAAIGMCSLLFVGYAVVSLATLAELRIGGQRFARIELSNELTADVLPPPEYLVETNMVILTMLGPARSGDQGQLNELIAHEQQLHRDYTTRLRYWQDKLTDQHMRDLLLTRSDQAAQTYFDLAETRYIPLLQRGAVDQAQELAFGELASAYQAHRSAVDAVVTAATAQAASDTGSAVALATSRSHLLLGLLVGTILVTFTVAVVLARRIAVGSIAGFAQKMSVAAEDLAGVASNLQTSLATTSDQIGSVSAATDQTSHAVATVAAASEQMAATVREITQTINQVVQVADEAVALSGVATRVIDDLETASAQIDGVVQFIIDVAGQTNLLALNATIEGARAGQAGRGFGVVASEVKELARKTSEATSQIRGTIELVQLKAAEAVASVESVANVMGQLNAGQIGVAHAVEEQSATMKELSRVAAEVAGATASIAASVVTVGEATNDASDGAVRVTEAAQGVAEMARDLRKAMTWGSAANAA